MGARGIWYPAGYINDIADCVTQSRIYRELRRPTSDVQTLQTNLDSLGHWTNTWQLRFNGEKCETMRITHSREKSTTDYTLGTNVKDVKVLKILEL